MRDSCSLILAIDTSCDDTSAAVVCGREIWSNIVASQVELHKAFGGVFPTIAKQAHKERIAPVVALALRRAQISERDLTAIAVTQGPGLAPALEVGIDYAKQLAARLRLPLLPINHIEGHLLSVLAHPRSTSATPPAALKTPALGLVISGGHTEMVLINALGSYERIGWTVDDAAGEALDKFGRMLDLGYPAGPVVEQLARAGDPKRFRFPVPMTTSGNYHLSYSGLKTAARRKIEELEAAGSIDTQVVADLCASFQYAVFHAFCYKMNKFLLSYSVAHADTPLFGVWLGGGVAANVALRRQLRATLKPFGLPLHVPSSKRLCSDNAAMIGVVGGVKVASVNTKKIGTLEVERKPSWKI